MVISFTGCSHSPNAEGSNVTSDLQHFNQMWNRAWLEKDGALVEKLMADEYVYIAPNGQLLDRQAILNIIRSPNYRLDSSSRTELSTKPIGEDAAVMVFHSQAEGRFEGKSFKDDHTCTMLCVRRGGEWRLILEQCSPNNR